MHLQRSRNRPALVLAPLLLWSFCSCAPIRVRSEHNPQADFSRLHTYAWLPDLNPTNDPRLDEKRLDTSVRSAVERYLGAKGYQKVDTTDVPTFWVAYRVYLQRKTQDVAQPIDYGPRGYRWWGGGMSEVRTYQYDEGTLLLDIVDATSNELMWRAAASATVDPWASVEKRQERIDTAVRMLLEKFPPR